MKSPFQYTAATEGEKLYFFLRNWLRNDSSREDVFEWISPLSHSDEWAEYVEQFMAIALTGRLVVGGRAIWNVYNQSNVFRTELRHYIDDCLVIERKQRDSLIRIAIAAINESRREISPGIHRKVRSWSRVYHPHCYMCGIILVYDDDTNTRAYTADHIWPRSFGGNSTAENLLPACGECNQKHKSDFASWAMTGIQSVILGINPPPDDLRRIAGVHRFALHHRQAQILAISERLSLRDAYLRIGPSSDPRTVNARDSAHFFNLTNTDVE